MRDLLGWASGAVVLALLIGVGYGATVLGIARLIEAWDCCPHECAGEA